MSISNLLSINQEWPKSVILDVNNVKGPCVLLEPGVTYLWNPPINHKPGKGEITKWPAKSATQESQ